MSLGFYLNYALRSLYRGGQRTLLATICIAFGVMSLVAMQLISANFSNSIMDDPTAYVGGDALLYHAEGPFGTKQLDEIKQLQTSGLISRYTFMTSLNSQIVKPAGRDGLYILQRAIGIDPQVYPLVGSIVMREPIGATLASLLTENNSAVMSRDVADRLGLKTGDEFAMSAQTGSTPMHLHLSGIVQSMPDNRGSVVLFNKANTRSMNGLTEPVTIISLLWNTAGNSSAIAGKIQDWKAQNITVVTPADVENDPGRKQVIDLFGFMFKGAGILGLIVGGVGVAATLRVLLARRTQEIAILKSLGYRQPHLVALFALEALILGIAGGIIGIGSAIIISEQLTNLLARTGIMLVDWTVDPVILGGGLVAGIATALVFGMQPIVAISSIRPAMLLRLDEATVARPRTTWDRIGVVALFVLLGVVFTSLCAVVMGSLIEGALIVAGALIGLVLLGLLLGIIMSVLLKLPMPRIRMLTLAKNNLKRERGRLIFPLVAFFAGVFAIGFATVAMSSAHVRLDAHQLDRTGSNLMIYAQPHDKSDVVAALSRQGVADVSMTYQLPLYANQADGKSIPGLQEMEGREAADVAAHLALTGDAWASTPDGIYLPQAYEKTIAQGTQIELVLADERKAQVRIGGFYTSKQLGEGRNSSTVILTTLDTITRIGGSRVSATFTGKADAALMNAKTSELRSELPQAIVLNIDDMNEYTNRLIQNLWIFVIAVASLALLGGAVLIANAVGLSMLERRREIGILKAVGFSRHHVLQTMVIEHSLLGLLGGISGMAGVAIAVIVINATQSGAQLEVNPLHALVVLILSPAIAAAISLWVAWRPASVHPLEVLRAE